MSEVFSLAGKTAIITGAAAGIGLAMAELFAKRGAAVQICDLNLQEAQASAKAINAMGVSGSATGMECNVADEASVNKCFAAIIAANGRIDILINNAGIGHVGDLLSTEGEDMDRMYNVNVKGIFHCSKPAVANMLLDEEKGGVVLNLASIASLIGLEDRFAYQMSKGAVLAMTYSTATDYVKRGVRCNCIAPGRVHTAFVDGFIAKNYPGKEAEKFKELSEYQPIGRMGKPAEIASLALYLCSDEAKFVTGACYPIDGGVTARM